jgi:hypothetical protein
VQDNLGPCAGRSGGPRKQWLVGHARCANGQTRAPDSPVSAPDSLVPHRSVRWPIKNMVSIRWRRTGQSEAPVEVAVLPQD